ncbi:unnamed protein product, partial [Ixodes hexagonus]
LWQEVLPVPALLCAVLQERQSEPTHATSCGRLSVCVRVLPCDLLLQLLTQETHANPHQGPTAPVLSVSPTAVSYSLTCHLRTHGDWKPWKCSVYLLGFVPKLR